MQKCKKKMPKLIVPAFLHVKMQKNAETDRSGVLHVKMQNIAVQFYIIKINIKKYVAILR
jgi:hypothetical protein